jgi:hypothetical protein
MVLFHGVQADQIPLGIVNQGDETVLPDWHFFHLDFASGGDGLCSGFSALARSMSRT